MLVLMIAIVLAIVSAASYRLTTQTQSTTQQEGSIRALAAADTGIEFGIKKANTTDTQSIYSYEDLAITLPGIDKTRSRILITDTDSDFVSPIVEKDAQYTYYVKDVSNTTDMSTDTVDISILFHSEGGTNCTLPRAQPAFEVTYIYNPGGAGSNMKRTVVEPCASGSEVITGSGFTPTTPGPFTLTTDQIYTFERKMTVKATTQGMSNLRLIIVRSLFGPSRLGFSGTGLPSQGKQIQAEAYTIGGPSKIITVFQSRPQIPAEFFVTTF